jgi:hypothetical protein
MGPENTGQTPLGTGMGKIFFVQANKSRKRQIGLY